MNDGRYTVRCFERQPISWRRFPTTRTTALHDRRSIVNSTAATVLTERATGLARPHERRSSVSAYARLRPDGCDTVHCSPVSSPSHSTVRGAERIHVLLTTYVTGAAILTYLWPKMMIRCVAKQHPWSS